MGGVFSRDEPQPVSQLLGTPWRRIPWGDKDGYLHFVRHYESHDKDLEQLRILLYGPAGSGKSSFINSVDSLLQGRMTGRALADGIFQDSFTKQYRDYRIQKDGPGTFYPFVFTDIMGLEKENNRGVGVEDIKLAMMGHIKDGYNFNPMATISAEDRDYNKDPTLNDKIHVLVCVISATTVDILDAESVRKMREVRLAARDLGIPQLAILTKIDEACPEVKANLGNVYRSKRVKKKIEELSVSLGIPIYCIFPVKSYHSEIDTDVNTDVLILSALRQIVDFGEDYVNDR